MATVSSVTIKYAAKGAKAAQKADRKVRDSVRTTGKAAREEGGQIDRWMTKHKRSINKIGMATTAVMGAVLSSSGRLRAELEGVRTSFGLFADTIVKDVIPGSGTLSEATINLALAYRDWESPLRTVVSSLLVLLALLWPLVKVGGLIATVWGSISPILSTLGMAFVSSTAAVMAFAGVLGLLIGLLGVGILEVTGVLDAVEGFGEFVGNILPGWVRDGMLAVLSFFLAPIALIGAAILGFVEGFLEGGISEGIDRMVSRTKEMMDIFKNAILNTIGNIVSLISGFGQSFLNAAKGLGQWLATGIFEAATNVWEKAKDIANGIIDRIPSVDDMFQLGKDIITGLADGIKAAVGKVGNAAKNAAGKVRDHWPGSDAKTGPLSDFTRIPDIMIDELARIGDNTGPLERGATQTATALRPPTGGGRAGGGGGSGPTVVIENLELRGAPSKPAAEMQAKAVGDEFEKRLNRNGVN